MKRILPLILILLLLLPVAVGCVNGDAPDASTSPDNTDGDGTQAVAEAPDIAASAGDLSLYTLIRAEDTSQELLDLASNLRTTMNEMCGKQIKIATDWVKRGDTPDPDAPEILLGNTNRPETAQVLSSITSSDYAVRLVGSKLVIAAYTMENLRAAVDKLAGELITVRDGEDGKVLELKNEFTYASGKAELFGEANPLSAYRIVRRKNAPAACSAAATLAERIEKLCGVTLEIVDPSLAPTEYEIIIGQTDRPESVAAAADCSAVGYVIRAAGKKLVITGGSAYAVTAAVNMLCSTLLSGICSPVFNLAADFNMVSDGQGLALDGAEDPALAEGADLRVMSFNILAELWNDKPPIKGRDELTVSILFSYMPDVAGLQEVSANWHTTLSGMLEGVYSFASPVIPGGSTNYSTLIYNNAKAELIETGVEVYSQGNDPKLRNLTWGYFRRISDGATYLVTCTHWDISANAHMRVVQAVENADIILRLTEKYKCPVFCTGDYNSNENSDEYKGFMAKTGLQDSKFDSERVERACKTTHTLGTKVSTSKAVCIDHIAVSQGVSLKYYNTLVCDAAINSSDHCPIYVDAALTKK